MGRPCRWIIRAYLIEMACTSSDRDDLKYDVFNPLTRMLEGSIDLPYNGTAMSMDIPGLFD